MSTIPCTTLYKININDRNYSSWTVFAADSLEPVLFDFDFSPCDQHLFTGDIFTISNGIACITGITGITCKTVETNIIGKPFSTSNGVDNAVLIAVNKSIRQHPIEEVGEWLRESMTAMKKIG